MNARYLFLVASLSFGAHCFALKNSLQQFTGVLQNLTRTLQRPANTDAINYAASKSQAISKNVNVSKPERAALGDAEPSGYRLTEEEKREQRREKMKEGITKEERRIQEFRKNLPSDFGRSESTKNQTKQARPATVYMTQAEFRSLGFSENGRRTGYYLPNSLQIGFDVGELPHYLLIFQFNKKTDFYKIVKELNDKFKNRSSVQLITELDSAVNAYEYKVKSFEKNNLTLIRNVVEKFNPHKIIMITDIFLDLRFDKKRMANDMIKVYGCIALFNDDNHKGDRVYFWTEKNYKPLLSIGNIE